jgi:hypothetical protein
MMATKEQYEFFKNLYESEDSRINLLVKRSEIFLSILSLVLTSVIFKVKELGELIGNSVLLKVLFFLTLTIFFVALVFVIISLRIRDYEFACDMDHYLESLPENEPKNEDFFDYRIAEYIVATTKNQHINNDKSRWLSYCLISILFGFISLIVFFYFIIEK